MQPTNLFCKKIRKDIIATKRKKNYFEYTATGSYVIYIENVFQEIKEEK